jgi:hypothetical protein
VNPQRGSAALELPLVVGLVLIPLGLLVLHVPVWIERQSAAREAAAEAARAVVVAPDGGGAADAAVVVARVEEGFGLPKGALALRLEVATDTVTASVRVEIPAARLPGLGTVGSVTWTARHSERRPDLGQRWP